ncbi:Acyl-CoA dehydrogenase family member 11 [Oryzias melastigma]|uniref:Acyl-CoA dehydrogenase family member 11 n=1 Tax=Oryzias melastigma TaxID=30732 RepID=A0A834BSY3_ORYME|nr:Acyl-CoA dehydrogenase family member 11 [Oryzias melastigma]
MDDLTTPVRQQHKFDVNKLQKYLSVKLRLSDNGSLSVRQYSTGQSNPTFLIQSSSTSYVLRKRPPGELLPGAHQVNREYRVQKALFSAGFPVPQPLLHCTDTSIIGTEFYVMQHVRGRIFRDLRLLEVTPAERSALYVAAVEVLAKLHSLELKSLDLEGFGKGPGYCRRQVSTWTKQYVAAAHRDIPAMNELSDWLMKNLPDKDDEVTLVHGDMRLDNLVFHPTEARVIAVLDWELSTTGNLLADLAYFLMPHYIPTNFSIGNIINTFKGIEGLPAAADLISIYCSCRGTPTALPHLNFYLALSFFKMASISQGIYARHLLGNASAPNAAQFGQSVEPTAQIALQLAKSPLEGPASESLFLQTAKGRAVLQQVKDFMQQHVLPAQEEVTEYYSKHAQSPQRWHTPQIIEDLKAKAKEAGLWNLFLPAVSGLSQLDYAYIAEETGRCLFAPDVFNCQAPDTGNMEVLHMFGSEEQKKKWLEPLLRGEIRSCFCMTEPDVASSDAANMECSMRRDKDSYIINGRKWWTSEPPEPSGFL